jgi:hypothetical protein
MKADTLKGWKEFLIRYQLKTHSSSFVLVIVKVYERVVFHENFVCFSG